MRDDHPTPTVGAPDVTVVEAVDLRPELPAVDVDAGDEEFLPRTEEEEGLPPVGVEFVAVLRDKLLNLPRGEAEAFGVT